MSRPVDADKPMPVVPYPRKPLDKILRLEELRKAYCSAYVVSLFVLVGAVVGTAQPSDMPQADMMFNLIVVGFCAAFYAYPMTHLATTRPAFVAGTVNALVRALLVVGWCWIGSSSFVGRLSVAFPVNCFCIFAQANAIGQMRRLGLKGKLRPYSRSKFEDAVSALTWEVEPARTLSTDWDD